MHRELFDGTYSFDDLLTIHDVLDVREENQSRYEYWRLAQREKR